MNPAAILDALDALAPLGELPRTGWVVRGCHPPESIAAHTLAVAQLVAMVCDALAADGVVVDGGRAVRMALFHDAAEARTGEVPMPIKAAGLADALHRAEAAIVDQMLPAPTAAAWRAAEQADDVEARVVRACDKLQMLATAWRYQRRGVEAAAFDGMWNRAENLRALELPVMRALYRTLYMRAGRVPPVEL